MRVACDRVWAVICGVYCYIPRAMFTTHVILYTSPIPPPPVIRTSSSPKDNINHDLHQLPYVT